MHAKMIKNLSNKLLPVELLILTCILTAKASTDNDASTRGILYFGFFFDEDTASTLETITDLYLNTLQTAIPEFSSFLRNVSFTANVTDSMAYHKKPLDPNTGVYDPLYHMTAKYCGKNQAGCKEYEENNSNFIDTEFEMSLVSFVLTSRTFGIRVNLTSQQRTLFDEENRKSKLSEYTQENNTLPFPNVTYSLFEYFDKVRLVRQEPFPPALPATSTKAHVTVGCAPKVSAVTTGPDVLEAIKYERMAEGGSWKESWTSIIDPLVNSDNNMVDDKMMMVTLFKPNETSPPEDYLFVVYPRVKVVANATLARYYQKEATTTTHSPSSKSKSMFELSLSHSIVLISIQYLAISLDGKFLNY